MPKGKPPAFQLYASDFDMDTASWDNDEVGIYFRLLMYQWVNGSVPDDTKRLSKIARIGQKRFQKRWQIISKKFRENGDNTLVNPRMARTRHDQDNYRKSQSESGKRGVEKKRKLGIYPFNNPTSDPSTDPLSENQALRSSSSPSKIKDNSAKEHFYLTNKKRKLKGKRLETFELFWDAFGYKKDRATAADSWIDIPTLTDSLVEHICRSARTAAIERVNILSNGGTPKFAQGWLSAKRWEDEPYEEPKGPTVGF